MEQEKVCDVFFEISDDLKKRGVFMKQELKCLRCGCPIVVGKHLRAKYICPTCHKEYLIHNKNKLSIEGQI